MNGHFCFFINGNSTNKDDPCPENLEMSGNLTAVREMSRILLHVREKSYQGKVV